MVVRISGRDLPPVQRILETIHGPVFCVGMDLDFFRNALVSLSLMVSRQPSLVRLPVRITFPVSLKRLNNEPCYNFFPWLNLSV